MWSSVAPARSGAPVSVTIRLSGGPSADAGKQFAGRLRERAAYAVLDSVQVDGGVRTAPWSSLSSPPPPVREPTSQEGWFPGADATSEVALARGLAPSSSVK